jgi:tungstate transport system substrate-binding protein
LFLVTALAAVAQQTFITIASTTSTEESGLFDYLLPAFAKEINIQVRVVAVGTEQALKIGERGDCQSLAPENAGLPSGTRRSYRSKPRLLGRERE